MKKRTLLFFVTIFFVLAGNAQIKGVTETGDEVILYQNGTWKYTKDFTNVDSINTNPLPFKKSATSTFLLKSEKGNLGFYIDPKKWNFKKALPNTDAEFDIDLKGQSIQAKIITESAEIPLESYVLLTMENGKAAAPDIHITKKEYRTVNGLNILYLQFEGSQAGIKFTYSGYYFTGNNITVQFVAFTYQNAMAKYAKDIEELLNGLVEVTADKPAGSGVKGDEKTADNTLPQGSFSSTNNCKPLFVGKWKYNTINPENLKSDDVIVDRTLHLTTELSENKKYSFQYGTKWINDCSYELIFKKTTKPNYKLIKPGEIIAVEITYIDKQAMRYRGTFRGITTEGEMFRAD